MATHKDRIIAELHKVGVTSYGMLKLEARALHTIIRDGEHIMAAVYGRYSGGTAMLVATDYRIIFFDKKIMFSKADEVRYEMVSGIENDTQAMFSAIVLHTRIKDYRLRFVNPSCAARFVDYIERRRIEQLEQTNTSSIPRPVEPSTTPQKAEDDDLLRSPPGQPFTLSEVVFEFLRNHDLAVLSTVSRSNEVEGATVYYTLDQQGLIYVVTKSETNKAHNMLGDKRVALTVFDEQNLSTVQIQGRAYIETNPTIKRAVFDRIVQPKQYKTGKRLPPVTDLSDGSFMVFRIESTAARHSDFATKHNNKR